MNYYTYKIINLINGKIYIGKAANIKKRWSQHKTAAKNKDPNDFSILHRSMLKYGFDNFIIEQLTEHEKEEDALAQESIFISELKTRDRNIGYNMTDGGDGPSGYKWSDEAKKKMSENRKGKYNGEANPFYGKIHSDKTKLILSDLANERYYNDPDKYDAINIQQCELNTTTCIDIQKLYLKKNISMEDLAKQYSIAIATIHNILHGDYIAIRGQSIITEELFLQIKKESMQFSL